MSWGGSTCSVASIRGPNNIRGGRTAARHGRRTSDGASTTISPRRNSQRPGNGWRFTKKSAFRTTRRSSSIMTTRWASGIRPDLEPAPLAALFLGVSSGFAFAMIGATLTTRLAQHGITKSAVTAFALTFLAYNLKFLWAPLVDHVRLPLIGRFGQRRSWLWLVGVLCMAAVGLLGMADPGQALYLVAIAAIAVGVAGATYDIIIDA